MILNIIVLFCKKIITKNEKSPNEKIKNTKFYIIFVFMHNAGYKYNKQDMIIEDVYWDIDLDKPKQKIRYEYDFFY